MKIIFNLGGIYICNNWEAWYEQKPYIFWPQGTFDYMNSFMIETGLLPETEYVKSVHMISVSADGTVDFKNNINKLIKKI